MAQPALSPAVFRFDVTDPEFVGPVVSKPTTLRKTALENSARESAVESTNSGYQRMKDLLATSGKSASNTGNIEATNGNTRSATPPTPHRVSSNDGGYKYQLVEHLQNRVTEELAHAWVAEDKDALPLQRHLESLYKSAQLPSDKKIRTWLRSYANYDFEHENWKEIPPRPSIENELYSPTVSLLNDIISEFHQSEQEEGGIVIKRRLARDTHRICISHNTEDAKEKALHSQPDISILLTGGCATPSADFPLSILYSDIGDIYDNKLNPTFGKAERAQMAVYAREIFVQQPHRIFVRVNIITPKFIRVLHFDRGGCYYSQPINYHTQEGAVFFVKLVLLGSAFDEALIGFDTSIYWENNIRRMKVIPPQIYDKEARKWRKNEAKVPYIFDVEPKPIFARRTIRSRATVCWRATYEGVSYVIKDYWRGDGRVYESEILQDLVGITGIGQMLCYENDRFSVTGLRGFSDGEAMKHDGIPSSDGPATVTNRFLMRIVVVEYGGTLETAVSAHQFLCAVRDIVKGHRAATLRLAEEKRVLQSDISLLNLRLAYDKPDECGVIIDWDLAKRMARLIAGTGEALDFRTGTQIYQSVRVLFGDDQRLSHIQPIDDLESIYYVMFQALFDFDAGGLDAAHQSSVFRRWLASADNDSMAELKGFFLLGAIGRFPTRFPNETKILYPVMHTLHRFLRTRINAVMETREMLEPTPLPNYSVEQAEIQYAQFLSPIEQAIADLEREGATGPYLRPARETLTPDFAPNDIPSNGFKRKKPDTPELVDESPSKRPSTSVSQTSQRPTRAKKPVNYHEPDTSEEETLVSEKPKPLAERLKDEQKRSLKGKGKKT
ncbi:hypothetical protein MIND_00996900 [Mycena indigotica]|uniref:Fungal-type protein kinase domain-containing protein n=1 Tax=Mycena indigotica TaxID=2126181 RepID=A0A8H6VY80_9AGAR|nr:uncharacterized protein MIND_00996900 [Mycena indigotica]KAF7294603.1 hypothetical protein MIND_00996900 [Mycena indigotica]